MVLPNVSVRKEDHSTYRSEAITKTPPPYRSSSLNLTMCNALNSEGTDDSDIDDTAIGTKWMTKMRLGDGAESETGG
jgi:hypothetical protein